MLDDFFTDAIAKIEKADSPYLIGLVLLVIYKFIQLALNLVTGFFRNDKTQFGFMRDLLKENIDTRRELAESNRRSNQTNEKLMTYLAENTAALSYLNDEVMGLKSTAQESYALTQVIHRSGEQSMRLLQDNVNKLDTLISTITEQHEDRQTSDTQTQQLLAKVLEHQQWLHLRILSDYPQKSLPEPKPDTQEKTNVQTTTRQPGPSRPQSVPDPASNPAAA